MAIARSSPQDGRLEHKMIDQVEKAAMAVTALRRDLTEVYSIHDSVTAPEDLVVNAERLMASIEKELEVLLSALSDRSLVDSDTLRDLVLGGDTVVVSFFGYQGPGVIYLQPNVEESLVLEDLTCDRLLSRFWSSVEDAAQPGIATR